MGKWSIGKRMGALCKLTINWHSRNSPIDFKWLEIFCVFFFFLSVVRVVATTLRLRLRNMTAPTIMPLCQCAANAVSHCNHKHNTHSRSKLGESINMPLRMVRTFCAYSFRLHPYAFRIYVFRHMKCPHVFWLTSFCSLLLMPSREHITMLIAAALFCRSFPFSVSFNSYIVYFCCLLHFGLGAPSVWGRFAPRNLRVCIALCVCVCQWPGHS